jgi:alpha-L-fucosidase 2
MSKGKKYIILSIVFIGAALASQAQQELKLWYKQPAKQWVEALPIGNGHVGAMVFGRVEEELIQLNESTLYSGGPVRKNVNPDAAAYLPRIREALLERNDYSSADALARKMQGLFTESYLPMGDLLLQQDFHGQVPASYQRSLDLNTAIASTRFTIDGVEYQREMFISAPENIMVVRLTATGKGHLSLVVSSRSQLHYQALANGNNELVVSGKAPAHVDPSYYNPKGRSPIVYTDTAGCNGMRFNYRIKAVTKDGTVSTDTSGIHIKNATEVILYIAAATSFNGFDKCPDAQGKDEAAITASILKQATGKSYAVVKQAHLQDYQRYFNRVSFSLHDSTSGVHPGTMPSDQRLKAYSSGGYDPGLETLYFQFGRYLLIASSRPGGPPANLQGIWNKELRAPWSSNYTININTEMNYWPAEVTNLSEMHQPLLDWIKDLSVTGTRTAKEFYQARGWVAHHNSEIWGTSNPVGDTGSGDPVWANWYMGANWLCQHLWEHYAFTGDRKFLAEKAYPLMKQAALFTIDWLVKDKSGYLVTAPSTTPENKFKDSTGRQQGVSVATTMDMSIIYDLFTNLVEASQVLGNDLDFRKELIRKREQLYPMQIGSKGQLQEWYKDFAETDPQHRHASHLFGLHPGRQISLKETPTFFNAAKKTLEIRGDGGTGWSRGWKINWWARLLDGDHAYHLIRQLLQYTDNTGGNVSGGGTYPNFFDAHPPFQIDGNFAGTAGMAEMLLQSHLKEIHLLPALPAAWPAGKITGLKARGAFGVNMEWKDSRLLQAQVTSFSGGKCTIRTKYPVSIKNKSIQPVKDGETFLLVFNTVKGEVYTLEAVTEQNK